MISRAREVWVGDSHAVYFSRREPRELGKIVRVSWSRYVYWLGPALAHAFRATQIHEAVFPRYIQRIIFVLGEIDVRTHLGHDLSKQNIDWVADYVSTVIECSRLVCAKETVICGPVPPARDARKSDKFPVRGSERMRLDGTRWLTETLAQLCAERDLHFVDCHSLLANASGLLSDTFNLDGCHVNAKGARKVRKAVQKSASSVLKKSMPQ